jgi:hypothetical protein
MLVKMMKPGNNRVHNVPSKDVAMYEKKGWSLAVKKTAKKKVEVLEEPKLEVEAEQLNLDLNEENE